MSVTHRSVCAAVLRVHRSGLGHSRSVLFGPDDQIHVECTWDNSAANQPIMDGVPLEPVDRDWATARSARFAWGSMPLTAVSVARSW